MTRPTLRQEWLKVEPLAQAHALPAALYRDPALLALEQRKENL